MQFIGKLLSILRLAISVLALFFFAWLIKTGEANTLFLNLWLGS